MKTKARIYIFVVFISSITFSCYEHTNLRSNKVSGNSINDSPVSILLQNTLKNVNDTVLLSYHGKELITSSLIKKLYSFNNYKPVWTSGMEPNHYAREMMRMFTKSQYYGLDTGFYQYSELKKLYFDLKEKKEKDVNKKTVEYEILMTHNCYKMMSHLKYGILHTDTSVYGKQPSKLQSSFPENLAGYIENDRLTEELLSLQPKSYEYRRLQKGLENFLNTVNLSNDKLKFPDPKKDSCLAYQNARTILAANNYIDARRYSDNLAEYTVEKIRKIGPSYEKSDNNFMLFQEVDTVLINALKNFQSDHGLSPDGKIGPNTRDALLITNRERFEQIAINLERLKWEKNKPERYVYVNIPSYRLRVIDDFKIVKTFNVVVGAKSTETPLLNSKIEYFITNPDWYVPFSISSNEILPKVKKDSTYLERHNFIILDKDRMPVSKVDWTTVENSNFNYFFQQAPGEGNALGKIKFYFENPYIVYIHDTNDKGKFKQDIRAFSHGCIRIQEPGEFAKVLLQLEPNPLADSVDNWLNGNTRKKVDLKEPIPLFVRYVTCEADASGHITFYQDIYNKDKKLKQALFSKNDF